MGASLSGQNRPDHLNNTFDNEQTNGTQHCFVQTHYPTKVVKLILLTNSSPCSGFLFVGFFVGSFLLCGAVCCWERESWLQDFYLVQLSGGLLMYAMYCQIN